jgi:hypothetical protein
MLVASTSVLGILPPPALGERHHRGHARRRAWAWECVYSDTKQLSSFLRSVDQFRIRVLRLFYCAEIRQPS